MDTVGNTDFVPFQGHDFSMRGMSSLESATSSGMGHLLSFSGTDTVPAIQGAELYYGANVEKELVGTSIPATEHSVQCSYGDDMAYFENMISKVYPSGFVSIVSDGYDFWDVVDRVIPALKDKIMARDGKVVVRPDSGDPVAIICGDPNGKTELERKGAVEALWDIFGGTVTAKGYKLLDSHIGLIYGDAITLQRAGEIMSRLAEKGFASINVVFGIGSFTYQYNTRDTFGFALKSTACVINGEEKHIFKNPKTDDGTKKSQKGRVAVLNTGNMLVVVDELSLKDNVPEDRLIEVFRDGKLLVEQTFSEIRHRLASQ
jgi:nicotinamide phosphoribosyltransferase